MFAEHLVLHSIGLCVAFLLALPVLKLAKRDPVVGYRLLSILLVAGLALPAFTLPLAGSATATGDRVLARIAVETEREAAIPAPAPPAAHAPAVDVVVPSVTLAAKNEAMRAATTKRVTSLARSLRTRARDAAVASSSWLRSATPYLALGWVLGAVLVGHRLLRRILGTARIVRESTPVDDEPTLACWRAASANRPYAERVQLRRSAAVDAPACWGITRPVILLPAVDRTPPGALTFALRHELVHLERRDPLAALAQALLKTVYWFHPVAWWLSARIDHIRELACDQLVVSNETLRKRYALALIDHAQAALAVPALAQPAHVPTLLHWAPTLPQLRRRIDMLLNKSTPLPLRRRLLVLGGAATAVLLLLAAQGTVAATLLSDAPLSERLVAFCPPKATPAPDTSLFGSDPASKPPKAKKPKKPKHEPNSRGHGVTQAPSDPFRALAFPSNYTPPVDPTMSNFFVGVSGDDTLRDALVHVMTNSNDTEARVTAAKALGTRLSDAEVRRAFARVLRDEWEGSEVREAVGDVLLESQQFTPEAHEIIAALLKRDGEDEDGEDHEDLAELGYVSTGPADDAEPEDLEDLEELRLELAEDLAELQVDMEGLDTATLEDLSELKEEIGDLNDVSIDLGEAIESLECDVECEEKCEESCEESCDETCEDEGDDAAEEAADVAEDRHEAVVELLHAVQKRESKRDVKPLLSTLQEKKSEGAKAIDLRELLHMLQSRGVDTSTGAKTMQAPPVTPVTRGEDA